MDDARKQQLLEKLAGPKWEAFKSGAKSWGKDTLGEGGKDIFKGLIGKDGMDVGGRLGRSLRGKQSMSQKLFGKESPGRKALMFGAGAAGIAGGIKGIDALTDAIADPLKKKSFKKKMMEVNPSLKKANQTDVGRIFNTLYRFNPKMASDPLVASSFVRRALQFKEEGIQPMDVKTLAEVGEQDRRGRGKGLLSEAFTAGAASLAGM